MTSNLRLLHKYTDIFPLDKIYHLWDKILVGPSSLPLFVGIAILQQFRQELLRSEFNEAIGIFSESFPEMDIEKCIETALAMCKVTPPSTCWLSYDQESRRRKKHLSSGRVNSTSGESHHSSASSAVPSQPVEQMSKGSRASMDQEPRRSKELELEKRLSGGLAQSQGGAGAGAAGLVQHWWDEPLTIEAMNAELAPRIHRSDFVRLRLQAMVIDIRPEQEFRNGHYPLSMQINPGQLDLLVHILQKLKRNYLVVIANRGDSGPEVRYRELQLMFKFSPSFVTLIAK
jgi:rhodanese-related sulfurtransferase